MSRASSVIGAAIGLMSSMISAVAAPGDTPLSPPIPTSGVSSGGGTPGGTSGQLQYNNSGAFSGVPAVNGDGTLNTTTGALTVSKTGGTSFGALATVTPGTGVATALGVNAGSAGAPVINAGVVGNPTGALPFTPSAVFNIMDYGAVCDGSTDDTSAINAALTAARASAAFTAGAPFAITGPNSGVTQYCKITSGLNFTGFTNVSGATPGGRVQVRDLQVFCSGAGIICIDGSGSTGMTFRNVSVKGDATTNMPEIGIQVGTLAGSAAGWHDFVDVSMQGSFAFADYYNVGSEDVTYTNVVWQNANSTTGPIRTLGSVTGGSTYTNGTYTNVPLTGGSGTGTLATVVVSGAVVTTVTITYEGRDYKAADSLSALAASIGGTGSGFSVPVSTVRSLVAVFDGVDHWRATSTFKSFTNTSDTSIPLSRNTFYNADIRNTGNGAGFWLAHTGMLRMVGAYCISTTPACVSLYDNSSGQNYGMNLELNIETSSTAAAAFLLEGSNATPSLPNFSWRGYHQAITEAFLTSAGITGVTMTGATLTELTSTSTVKTFSSASIWAFQGDVTVPVSANWTTPLSSFTGRVFVGTTTTYTVSNTVAGGAAPTPSGACSVNTQTGGNTAGTFKANGACAASTVILTFAQAAPTGWACRANDQTTPGDAMNETASGASSVTFTGTMVSADVVSFLCQAY